MGDNERQDFGTMGDNWGQRETMGNNWRQPETKIDKKGDKGDKTSGRRTHHPTQAHMWGQWETIRKQDVGKADTPFGETMGDNGR